MSIEQLGQSLLGDARRRTDEAARRRAKDEERKALMGLGINIAKTIGNEFLEQKANDFFSNEALWQESAHQKQARNNQSNIFAVEKEIQTNNISYEQYAEEKFRPIFEARASEMLDPQAVGPAGAYNEVVTQNVRQMAKEWAANHKEALRLANSVGTEEEFNAILKLNSNKVVPKNVYKWGAKAVGNFFRGQTNEDLEEEALLAITEGDMSKNADKLNLFMDKYNKTKDLAGSFDYASLIIPETDEAGFTTDVIEDVMIVDDKAIAVKYEQKTNINTGEKRKTLVRDDEGAVDYSELSVSSPETSEMSQKLLTSLNNVFNYGTDARTALTPAAYAKFASQADELGINITQPKSSKEYTQLSNIYSSFVLNADNLKDAAKQNQFLKTLDLVAPSMLDVRLDIMSLSEITDPDERQKEMKKIISRISTMQTTVYDSLYGN